MSGCWVRGWLGVLAAGLIGAAPLLAMGGPDAAPATTAKVTVTVHPRQAGADPVLYKEDIRVYEDNQRRPVVSWVEANPLLGPLDLTILVDDSIGSQVSLQFRDLADFFRTLPAGTRVRIAYAAYGGNRIVQDFTGDYQAAAQALRIPVGPELAGGSIYQSVVDLLKHWPQDGRRRELLVISDGIDFNQGLELTDPTLNLELQPAIDLAQRTNIPIYTIFARGSSVLEENGRLLLNGQGCLLRLSSETGGQSYFQGTFTPVDFAPYLKEFSNDLLHQYELTFEVLPAPKTGYQPLHVTTEVPGVRLFAPARVFIPKAE